MILGLDIGNSQIYGGVFDHDQLQCSFRHDTTQYYTSDQIGIFLKNVLRENNVDPSQIEKISISSVAPHLDYSISVACQKYFHLEPFFLQYDSKMNIQNKYACPKEVGADLLAESIAAADLYPNKNIIIVDLGTATTFCIITDKKEFLGGVITPGIRLSMETLQSNTAKLPTVKIIEPKKLIGTSTAECIQVGLYYSQLATIKEITQLISTEVFAGNKPIILGTGGFSHLFAEKNIFTKIIPTLVLDGLRIALKLNL